MHALRLSRRPAPAPPRAPGRRRRPYLAPIDVLFVPHQSAATAAARRPPAAELASLGWRVELARPGRNPALLARDVRRFRPRVVHFASHRDLAAAAAVRAAGVPVVIEVDEVLPGRARARLGALAIRGAADAAIAVSRACAEPLAEAGVAVEVAYPGHGVPPAPGGSASTARVVAGAGGGVSRRLGTDLLVRAAELLAPARGRIEFQLAGPLDRREPEWTESVLARARRAAVAYRPERELEAAIRDWDIAVVPSREEGFSVVALQAMALGLPVVATAVGGLPEQVTPATGILVLPDDAGALATAIGEFANYPERRARAGNEGRERVAERFSPRAQAEATARAYERAVAARE